MRSLYSLVRRVPARDHLVQRGPGLGISLVIAELFFRLGSFSAEALAFLATWLVVDAAIAALRRLTAPASPASTGRDAPGPTFHPVPPRPDEAGP